MDKNSAYQTYLNCIIDIEQMILKEQNRQNEIAEKERQAYSKGDSEYEQLSDQLENARRTVRAQYRSVWESCTREAGLKRPQDQRPEETALPWREAVRLQEKSASVIRTWFEQRTAQAIAERERRLREEKERQAAAAAARAEEERKKAEEEERKQREFGESLIEKLKNRHRKK